MLTHPDIGVLNSGKCYVFLDGYGMDKEPFYGTETECEAAIAKRDGVAEPIPVETAPAVTAASAVPRTKKRTAREYIVTFKTSQVMYAGTCVFGDLEERVFAYDRNDALKQGREIIREAVGRYGPKYSITARLAK
jgi:hypothetical protein